jgi:hypothetical protein
LSESRKGDGVRIAAAVWLEEVAALAGQMAERLRSNVTLVAGPVADAMVAGGKTLKVLRKHNAKLLPPSKEKP